MFRKYVALLEAQSFWRCVIFIGNLAQRNVIIVESDPACSSPCYELAAQDIIRI